MITEDVVDRVIEEGCEWLRATLKATGKHGVVLGLSGGLDSAVVAFWASRAIGSHNVYAISMPYLSKTNDGSIKGSSSIESVHDALLVVTKLELNEYLFLPITDTVDAEAKGSGLNEFMGFPEGKIAFANLKARVRAVRLRTHANMKDLILLGTENKTENMLGYFTLGGDEQSDMELLSNFYKTEVRMIARALGVPDQIINKPPSADLWPGQTDEGELGFTYEEADTVLSGMEFYGTYDMDHPVADRSRATEFKRAPKPTFVPKGDYYDG